LKKSDMRIQFISDYISAYEQKIKLLNNNGLFDSAKLFELFAIEVGSLYLGQRFGNLNVNTYTYPCVDLISADGQTYIQVSTTKDIPAKIKTTLEEIKDSKRSEINSLTNVKFIVLNNESVDKVKDYTGKDLIGSVPFTKANDLITTNDILQKAINDADFQINLFNLLKKEFDSIKDNSYMLDEAIKNSRILMNTIDCKINSEYEIDRSELISKIKIENHKNISIQGGAGSGKSVLSRKLIESDKNILYARAERFIEETDINKIWGFNIRQTLEYLNGKPIVFFIDSLEFIADNRTKLDLLCILYEYIKDYPTAKTITSCRTSDKNAFIKIEGNYSIHSYEVSELTITEQSSIAKKYPIIKKMLDMNSYADLLKSPFYINLIISKIADIDNISDENQLREHIWQHIICLNDNKIEKVIDSIVFDRARNFSLGSRQSNHDTKTIEKLISKDVLVRNGDTVRLKYDIFEDICFEQYLDNDFYKCKGNYNEFFTEIESLGRCIYRRYQIWIENKLFAKSNREKFLYGLIFSKDMPQDWKKQTEIGLLKSRYCSEFFNEYGQTIIKNGILNDYIKTTNLYAFEIINEDLSKLFSYIQLRPSGEGRRSLIHLIAKNKLYEKDAFLQFDLEKLCTDYSKTHKKEKHTAEEACLTLEFIVEKYIIKSETKDYYKLDDTLNALLKPIYQMAKYSKEWIKNFWIKLISYYKSDDREMKRLAADIINDTLKFEHVKLAEHLPIELCDLAEMFWTYSPEKNPNDYDFGFFQRDRHDISYQYGLNKNAERYGQKTSQSTAINSNFFFMLFRKNFWIGLNWVIDFVNKAILSFAEKQNEDLPIYEINFIENDVKKEYLGFVEMWLVTTEEHRMPMIISDLIYCLKKELCDVIKNDAVVNKETVKFAENVKRLIYEKSNNIALLTIIADIGMEFWEKLPGFALDLVTNIGIIRSDLQRLSLLIKSPEREMVENQIFMIMGMPPQFIPDRYNKKDANQCDLRKYVQTSQLYCSEDIEIRCHEILDYLYSIVPNDKDNAINYMQIQNMDLRTAQAVKVDDTTIALVPTITGEAEKITAENKIQRQAENAVFSLIKDCSEKFSKNEFKLDECLVTIDQLIETRKNIIMPETYDKFYVSLLAFALKNKKLNKAIRKEFCRIWIEGINSYFSNGSFIFEYAYSWVLFSQIETDVCDEIKNQIKQMIINLILYDGYNGVVSEIAHIAKQYLKTNEQLARTVFNTIIKLAEDEMDHQKFNVKYINNNNGKTYQSKKDEITKEYLFNNTELDLSNFEMNNYDITTFCYAINCGLSLNDVVFAGIVKKFTMAMLDVWKANEITHDSPKILGAHPLYEAMCFFRKELIASEMQTSIVLNILFDVDFKKFTHETIEFYHNVFGSLLAEYFDSHSDKMRRNNCVEIIRALENKIISIKEEKVRIELYKSLILSITGYGGSGDWSKFPSRYSYQDKQFLNDVFNKYGKYHLKEMISTIHKLHLNKLLPEILLSVRDVLKNALKADTDKLKNKILAEIKEIKDLILILITKAFLDFNGQIKQDDNLTKAFEEILEMLVEINYEEAATILDEFRIH